MMSIVSQSIATILISCHCMASLADDSRWWPVQALPTGVVRTRERGFSFPDHMLLQSVAGLTAKSVNHGKGDEMVWVSTDNPDIENWFALWLKKNPSVQVRGEFSPWELVDRYVKKGVIRGYILYSTDQSEGPLNDHRKAMNQSANIATSLAGLLDGVLIDESQEQEARQHGLTLLMDTRDKTSEWCFATYRDRFDRKMLCTQDPKKSHVRDLAIAHQSFVLFGADKPLEAVLEWLEPLSPIAGWNGGDEFETTRLSSIYGHIQTATDWCSNLPVLMAGSDKNASPPPPNDFDLAKIDFSDRKNAISFVLTDGDNVQWFETSFVHAGNSYWDNPTRGKIPFGWSCCHSELTQVCPVLIDYLSEQRTKNDSMIEWGGGYYYPDMFGMTRTDRDELLAKQARRTWNLMQRTGTRIIGFNMAKISSDQAIKSYETFAKQTDGLAAIFVFQYAPYEGGAGIVHWVKDAKGIEIPVISARYSIWEHTNRERSGTPAKVASEIRDSISADRDRDDWVVVHAWSYFRLSKGFDPSAEEMPQENAVSNGGVRGYSPAVWCAERLPENVKVVSPEELCWRIRMKHDPVTTTKLLKQ